jgi:hypothetical protein
LEGRAARTTPSSAPIGARGAAGAILDGGAATIGGAEPIRAAFERGGVVQEALVSRRPLRTHEAPTFRRERRSVRSEEKERLNGDIEDPSVR